ncbi:MAG: hypothetical protein CYPHOPRED_005927 [Cyphobasidiales sp. Tagirdzhanova-0007]|nr:MAG: hypothetical protein CYPHOPRED_005927 [Cyphobasidiales sp. Tagirdzhanova-0007]
MAQAVDKQAYMTDSSGDRYFVVHVPSSTNEAIENARRHIVFTDDFHQQIDEDDFYLHAQNSARVIDSTRALAKLFVLPVDVLDRGRGNLKFLFVMGHEITDGLTTYTWLNHFLNLLNVPMRSLETEIRSLIKASVIRKRLPSAQEDLYPPIFGQAARRSWYWAITRVLRHVRKPLPAAFPNPLRRALPLTQAISLPSTYPDLLNYAKVPILNTYTVEARVPKLATQQLHRLCREAGASVGAGCFVLVAMVMMLLHEQNYSSEVDSARPPFIGGFPLNPRPLFNHAEPPDSLMLAFSDGVVLPFLSSSLDTATRFKVLVRQAHRQLGKYKKRQKEGDAEKIAYMGNHGAGRVLAIMYTSVIDWPRLKLLGGVSGSQAAITSPQGLYPVNENLSQSTNNISSLGRSAWKRGQYDINMWLEDKGEDAFVADFRAFKQNVRAREGEFHVAVCGEDDGTVAANVSYDGNSIDADSARKWKFHMETILDGLVQSPRL